MVLYKRIQSKKSSVMFVCSNASCSYVSDVVFENNISRIYMKTVLFYKEIGKLKQMEETESGSSQTKMVQVHSYLHTPTKYYKQTLTGQSLPSWLVIEIN